MFAKFIVTFFGAKNGIKGAVQALLLWKLKTSSSFRRIHMYTLQSFWVFFSSAHKKKWKTLVHFQSLPSSWGIHWWDACFFTRKNSNPSSTRYPPDPPGSAPDPAPLLQVLWVAALTCRFSSESAFFGNDGDTVGDFSFRSRVTKRRTSQASLKASFGGNVAQLFRGITGCCNRVHGVGWNSH